MDEPQNSQSSSCWCLLVSADTRGMVSWLWRMLPGMQRRHNGQWHKAYPSHPLYSSFCHGRPRCHLLLPCWSTGQSGTSYSTENKADKADNTVGYPGKQS